MREHGLRNQGSSRRTIDALAGHGEQAVQGGWILQIDVQPSGKLIYRGVTQRLAQNAGTILRDRGERIDIDDPSSTLVGC